MSGTPHPRSYYAATANPAPPCSALAGEIDCDVCVIGGGFTGLSSALHLAERGYDVVLVEANRIGWGASGRNGGQLGSGQAVAASGLVARYGVERAQRLWRFAEEAKALARERIARHDIACDLRSGVLMAAAKSSHADWMKRECALLNEQFDYDRARFVPADEFGAFIASARYHAGVIDTGAGHLHPLNYALGLARVAVAAGARLHEGTRVEAIEPGVRPRAQIAGGAVRARHLLLCCNGYFEALDKRLAAKIMPIGNYMLATAPLGAERAKALMPADAAVFDTKFVVDYYRLSEDGRLLFGGGENYSGREPSDIKAFVRRFMLRVFPQLADVPIDYGWGGQLAITRNRLPQFERLPGNVYAAQGFSGHGVALTALAGKLMAEAIAGDAERFDVFAGIEHRDFPGGTLLRKPGLVLAMIYYALRDRL